MSFSKRLGDGSFLFGSPRSWFMSHVLQNFSLSRSSSSNITHHCKSKEYSSEATESRITKLTQFPLSDTIGDICVHRGTSLHSVSQLNNSQMGAYSITCICLFDTACVKRYLLYPPVPVCSSQKYDSCLVIGFDDCRIRGVRPRTALPHAVQ